MFGKAPHATLELRKQLLIAESELNRAELAREWGVITEKVGGVARQGRSVLSWISASVPLLADFLLLRRDSNSRS